MKKLGLIALSISLITISQNCFAQNDWIIRGRAVYVRTDVKSTVSDIGGKVGATSDLTPELDITKFITPNIAAELIAGTTRHDISLKGSAAGNSVGLGSVKLLPPTLTLQYHFSPTETIRPYAGAGLNYTIFYGAKTGGAATSLQYQNHLGYALQAGLDYMIDKKVSINFDIKKIFLKTRVQVNDAYTANVRLDPWLFGVGMGYHF